MEMIFTIGDRNYTVHVIKRKVKTYRIKIDSFGAIFLYAHLRSTENDIIEVLNNSQDWLITTLEKVKKKSTENSMNDILNQKKMWLFGRLFDVIPSKVDGVIDEVNCTITLKPRSLDATLKAIRKKYRSQITEIFNQCLEQFNQRLKQKRKPILVYRSTKGRYGCCFYQKNTIQLTDKLVHFSEEEIAYIAFHELCHFIEHAHNKAFYDLLSTFVSNHKVLKKQMKQRDYMMRL